ncbi:MAG: ribosome biogenesis GTPase Der [Actinomycetaceae bacterium]|nr:ribosome biogenesis GTPase Der [Actinomycetaceae bacterium]
MLDSLDEEQRASALLAGLELYELDDDDLALLEGRVEDEGAQSRRGGLPVLAVIGRPNVGKSTLVNRVLGRREAVVLDQPGVTRDRVSYPAEWAGTHFTIVDTGGWEVDVLGLDASVAGQAEIAIDMADVVMFVVDGRVGATSTDERVVQLLRKKGKPVILAVNKIDSEVFEADAAYLWSLGLGEPYPVSALHGRGSGELLDRVIELLPQESSIATDKDRDVPHVALIGRPNVGKSSLLNQLAGENRVVVDEVAGTTRDPVDEVIDLDGQSWVFVDTAGVRRRVHLTHGADFYASLRTQQALENADLALVIIDASVPLTEQDIRVIGSAIEAGRALVIVNNKWDLVDEERQHELKLEFEEDLPQAKWASRVNISAATGWHTNRLTRAMRQALDSWQTRIPTGRLNAFLGELVAANPHPLRGGKQPRILFGTQAATCPPRFVIFATGFLDPGYRRFIERKLREEFGFEGSPIQISVRVREKRAFEKSARKRGR